MARAYNRRPITGVEPYMGQYDDLYGPFYGEGFHSYLMYTRYETAECISWEPYSDHQIKIYLDNGRTEIYHIFNKTIRTVFESDHSDESIAKDFAINLYDRMREKGYSEGRLAERAGVSQATISKYLKSMSMPSLSVAVRIADALGCSVTDLLES